MKRYIGLLLIAVYAFLAGACKAGTRPELIMDMVHHNPGDALYESKFNHPQTISEMGYDAKCFHLFDSPTLAIDWDGYNPEILPAGSADREWVETKAARLDSLYDECKACGIDVYAMADLVLLPKRLVEIYGLGENFGDPLDERIQDILRYQMRQCFKQFPQLDGLVVRIGETYLEDAPFHKGNIINKSDADKCIVPLLRLLREEICVKLGKKLVFRTWRSFDEDEDLYNYVSGCVEPHRNLFLGVKHCEGDFHRGNDYSRIQGQGRHKQVIEVQCAREYEGKGAFPNYIARGVIDGFEEDSALVKAGKMWCLRDMYRSGKLGGVWTWSRGGGWEGPYIKEELWCDLNAWVVSRWAGNPELSEEEIFNDFCRERLNLDETAAAIFREIALCSEHAVIRGIRSAVYPEDIYWLWTRDEYITFPEMPRDSAHCATILGERDEAVAEWEHIVALSEDFNSGDSHLNEVVRVTSRYGLQMFRIFRAVTRLAAIHQSVTDEDKYPWLAEYDDAWEQLAGIYAEFPETCPTLYNRTVILRTGKFPADEVISSMR